MASLRQETRYPKLWEDHGDAAKVPIDEWMRIPLKENRADLYIAGQVRVYPVGQKDRDVIDDTFKKLHQQGRLSWAIQSTPCSSPCSLVWKTLLDGTRKGRLVVDIRGLNQIVVANAYLVSS